MLLVDLLIPIRKASGKYYVYLFVMEGTEYYKIGYTNHLYRRLSTVNTSSPQAVACIQYYEFEHLRQACSFEKYLHKNFKEKRLRNRITDELKEWFILNAADLLEISKDYQKFNAYLQLGPKPLNKRLKEVYLQATAPKPELPTIPQSYAHSSVADQITNLDKLTKRIGV